MDQIELLILYGKDLIIQTTRSDELSYDSRVQLGLWVGYTIRGALCFNQQGDLSVGKKTFDFIGYTYFT